MGFTYAPFPTFYGTEEKMEITKEFLQAQIAGLQEQLGNLIGQQAIVRGALGNCEALLRYFETPEPPVQLTLREVYENLAQPAMVEALYFGCEKNGQPEPELVERFEGADVEGLAKGRACGSEGEGSTSVTGKTEETTVPTG